MIPERDYAKPRPPAGITVGPLARSVRDAALVTQVMAGPDGRDPFSIQTEPDDFLADIDKGVKGMRFAWTRSEERRVGQECVVRVDIGGRRFIKKKNI